MSDLDEVFEKIGGFGNAQKKIYYLMSLVHIAAGFHTLILTFIGIDPKWTCKNEQKSCLLFDSGECEPRFDPAVSSIISEWNLICGNSLLSDLSQSIFFVGAMLGAWIFGTVSDRFGRRKAFFISVTLSAASGFGYSLAPNFYVFVIFRLLVALNLAGVILSSFVLSMEIVGAEDRTYAGLACSGIFGLSYPLLAGLAYLIPNWRLLGVVSSIALLPFLLLWRVIPESPRWLLVNGREDDAKAVLTRLALDNGVDMPAGQLKRSTATVAGTVSLLDLFRGSVIRKRTLILFIAWFCNSMLYYVLSLSAGDLGGSRYVSFSLSGLVEIPSIIIVYFLISRFGRRLPHGTFLAGGGVACLSVTILQWLGSDAAPKIVLAMVGKFAIAGSFGLVYLYTAELFPTEVRNIGAGLSTIGARLGGILSPIILFLGDYDAGVPTLILGVLGIFSGLLSLSLPETLNKRMPETLSELKS